MESWQPSILGDPHEQQVGDHRPHPYILQSGGQYNQLYGQSSLRSGQKPALEGHGNYNCNKGAYRGRDLWESAGGRYADSIRYTHQHKSEMYNYLDQTSLLRHGLKLKSQSLQSASHDGSRQADYLTARDGIIEYPTEELVSYGGRADINPGLALVENSPYREQPAPSLLGAALQRNVDDLPYARHTYEWELDRERKWERERERKWQELQGKECDRDLNRKRKRALESRLKCSPLRAYKNRRGSSLTKNVKIVAKGFSMP